MMTDPIADLLTRIRNAYKAHKVAVDVPASGIKREIVRILQEKKFVKDMMENISHLPPDARRELAEHIRGQAELTEGED